MSAIITFIPSLVLPSLCQLILSGSQVVILPIIEVITSVIYMALTALGCGGCGVGGAVGGGGIMTFIVGTIMSWVAVGVGVIGGGFADMINFVVHLIMAAYGSVIGFVEGLW